MERGSTVVIIHVYNDAGSGENIARYLFQGLCPSVGSVGPLVRVDAPSEHLLWVDGNAVASALAACAIVFFVS